MCFSHYLERERASIYHSVLASFAESASCVDRIHDLNAAAFKLRATYFLRAAEKPLDADGILTSQGMSTCATNLK